MSRPYVLIRKLYWLPDIADSRTSDFKRMPYIVDKLAYQVFRHGMFRLIKNMIPHVHDIRTPGCGDVDTRESQSSEERTDRVPYKRGQQKQDEKRVD